MNKPGKVQSLEGHMIFPFGRKTTIKWVQDAEYQRKSLCVGRRLAVIPLPLPLHACQWQAGWGLCVSALEPPAPPSPPPPPGLASVSGGATEPPLALPRGVCFREMGGVDGWQLVGRWEWTSRGF